jgi:glycosyltransferase involved in cell wall biosynthesis
MRPLFSITTIGKNEEHVLPRLFKSLENFKARGGEMVFVDTGSTDKTVEMAKAFGFIVHEVGPKFLFKIDKQKSDAINAKFVTGGDKPVIEENEVFFNYSEARNYAASLASSDFVIQPDCDEEMTSLDIDKLNELILAGWERLTFDYVYSNDADGNPYIYFICDRGAFDRRKFQWKGAVHENLQGTGKCAYAARDILYIRQYPADTVARAASHKDLAGLAMECFNEPTNDRNLHYFGRELMYKGRYQSAIAVLAQHCAMNKWDLEKQQSLIFIGDCLMKLKQEEAAVMQWSQAFAFCGRRREPLTRLAAYYKDKKDYTRVAAYAAAAMEIPELDFYGNVKDVYTSLPHHFMYWAKLWQGKKAEAKLHWQKCLEFYPNDPTFLGDEKFFSEVKLTGAEAIEGWMASDELKCLEGMAKLVDDVVEIGSWKGRSTYALLSNCKGTVYAVDTFEGCIEDKATIEEAKAISIEEVFLKNVGHFANLKTMKMTSLEAAAQIESADMIFIDGSHEYEDVLADIKAWLPKAKKIICGHDYTNHPGVKRAVDELIGPVTLCNSIWIKTL